MIQSKTIKVINFLEVLDHLQELEFKRLNIPIEIVYNNSYRLPDGSKCIRHKMCDYIKDSCHGNQQFCNDSLFRLQLSDCIEEDIDLTRPDVPYEDLLLFDKFKKYVNGERYDRFFVFDVCW